MQYIHCFTHSHQLQAQIRMHSFSILYLWVLCALQATPCYSSVVNSAYSARGAIHARDKAESSGSIRYAISSSYSSLSGTNLSTATNSSQVPLRTALNSAQSSNRGSPSRTESSGTLTSTAGSRPSNLTTWEKSDSTRQSHRFTSALPSRTLSQPPQQYRTNLVGAKRRRGRQPLLT